MNYQEQLRNFIEDYATAIYGDKDIIVSLEVSYEEKKVGLYAHNKEKSTLLIEYDFGSNHEVDEYEGVDNPRYFLNNIPFTFVKYEEYVQNQIVFLFGRFCNIFSINYVLSDLPYTVKSEDNPQKEMAISALHLSNRYRKITLVNSIPFQRCVEIYLSDGTFFTQVLIDSIEES